MNSESKMAGFFREQGNSFSWLRSLILSVILFFCFCFHFPAAGQQTAADAPAASDTNAVTGTPEEQIAKLQVQVTNAWQQVSRIVNQPVRAYVRSQNLPVSLFSPGWFHDGAIRPNFDTVDVRQTQEFPYDKAPYVTSDFNPNIVFMGRDLEFNSMTKYFYADRTIPKHKLTEAQMVEINRLYRIIGHGEAEIRRLQHPASAEVAQLNNSDGETQTDAPPAGTLAGIRSIPRQTRLLYGGIGIGVLVVLMVAMRLLKKNSE